MKEKSAKKGKTEAAARYMQAYLERLHHSGTELFVDGEAVYPQEAIQKAVCEEGGYMADYVLEEDGKIKQIRFDKVDLQ